MKSDLELVCFYNADLSISKSNVLGYVKSYYFPFNSGLTIWLVNLKLKEKCLSLESFLILFHLIIKCQTDLFISYLSFKHSLFPCCRSWSCCTTWTWAPCRVYCSLQCTSRTLSQMSTCAHRCNDVQGLWHLSRISLLTLHPVASKTLKSSKSQNGHMPPEVPLQWVCTKKEHAPSLTDVTPYHLASKQHCLVPGAHESILLLPPMLLSK